MNVERTTGEMRFESYLALHGLTDWSHEVLIGGKRPDYRLAHHGSSLYFEVKEFAAPKLTRNVDWHDLYRPIREKIRQAANQFKGCKEFPCSLVLSNLNGAIVRLGSAPVMMAAMLGDLAFQVPVGLTLGPDNLGGTIFTHGGKMFDDRRSKPQNTTISSLIVVGAYSLHEKKVVAVARRRRRELGRNMTIDEAVEEAVRAIESSDESEDAPKVRVMVYENPFARIPLTRELFRGSFDERWSVDGGFLRRIFVGDEIVRSEEALGETAR